MPPDEGFVLLSLMSELECPCKVQRFESSRNLRPPILLRAEPHLPERHVREVPRGLRGGGPPHLDRRQDGPLQRQVRHAGGARARRAHRRLGAGGARRRGLRRRGQVQLILSVFLYRVVHLL